jgi:hypothetical protein
VYFHVAEKFFWPRVEDEYRQELKDRRGSERRGRQTRPVDMVAYNACLELARLPKLAPNSKSTSVMRLPTIDRCSAFVATSKTRGPRRQSHNA